VAPKMFAGTDDHGLKELDNDAILLARGKTAFTKTVPTCLLTFILW
jgi:hypothetical protein